MLQNLQLDYDRQTEQLDKEREKVEGAEKQISELTKQLNTAVQQVTHTVPHHAQSSSMLNQTDNFPLSTNINCPFVNYFHSTCNDYHLLIVFLVE